MNTTGTPTGRTEICPGCGDDIVLKMNPTESGPQPTAYTTNGTRHFCAPLETADEPIPIKKPIGDLVMGRTIAHFQVRERKMTLRFTDGTSLDVSARGAALRFRVTEGDGNLVEE